MMHGILLVIDDWETAGDSVRYAAELARTRHSRLRLLVCIHDPLLELNRYIGFENMDGIREQLEADAAARARRLSVEYSDVVGDDGVEVCWSATPHREIIDVARRSEAGLIIKHVAFHSLLAEFIHTPDDWQLLRYAECPVLVLAAHPQPPAFVVAAIDSLDDRPDHLALSARVLDEARAMATGFGVPLRVVAVCPDPGLSHSLAGTLPSYIELTESLYAQATQGLQDLVGRLGVPGAKVEVLRGMVDRQLAAATAGNGLLVIGGCSNRGLKGRLLGNVAEKVLHYVDGNVLVVV